MKLTGREINMVASKHAFEYVLISQDDDAAPLGESLAVALHLGRSRSLALNARYQV